MKKRGYLLIECALYIWFCAIFSSMILTLFLPYIKEFKNEIKESTRYNYMLSASMYIENTILNNKEVYILKDKNHCMIELYENSEKLEKNVIRMKEINKNNKLVVEHYRLKSDSDKLESNDEASNFNDEEKYTRIATNTILKDVESFCAMENGNIITISLKQYGGEERVFCYENRYGK